MIRTLTIIAGLILCMDVISHPNTNSSLIARDPGNFFSEMWQSKIFESNFKSGLLCNYSIHSLSNCSKAINRNEVFLTNCDKNFLFSSSGYTGTSRNNKTNSNTDSARIKRASVFIELFGNTYIYYSLNFEYMFDQYKKMFFSISFGYGYKPAHDIWKPVYQIPFSMNMIRGTQRHFLDTGLGMTYVANHSQGGLADSAVSSVTSISATIRLGYKFQAKKSGFFFKVGITYFKGIDNIGEFEFFNSEFRPGLSVGYRWGRKNAARTNL